MSKKNREEQNANELLDRIQESFRLEDREESVSQDQDDEDSELRRKLEETLNNVSYRPKEKKQTGRIGASLPKNTESKYLHQNPLDKILPVEEESEKTDDENTGDQSASGEKEPVAASVAKKGRLMRASKKKYPGVSLPKVTDPQIQSSEPNEKTAVGKAEKPTEKAPEKTERNKKPAAVEKEKSPSKSEKPASQAPVVIKPGKAKMKRKQEMLRKIDAEKILLSIPKPVFEKSALSNELSKDDGLNESLDDVSVSAFSAERKKAFLAAQQEENPSDAGTQSVIDRFCRESGLSRSDLSLLFDLGYENELGRIVGFENVKRLKYEYLRQNAEQKRVAVAGKAFGSYGKEYLGENDRDAVLAAYSKHGKNLILRVLWTVFFAAVLVLCEIPGKISFLANLDRSLPLLFPICSVLCLIGCAAGSWRTIIAGARGLLNGQVTPYSTVFPNLAVVLIYDIFAFFLPLPALHGNLFLAGMLLLTVLCDALRLNNEKRTFRLISAPGQKAVLEPVAPRKKKLRKGERVIKVINDQIGEKIFKNCRADQIVGFFRRNSDMTSAKKPFTVFLISSLCLSFVTAFAVAVNTLSFRSAAFMFVSCFLLTTPVSAAVGWFFPLYLANRYLFSRRCAVIGEESVSEYSGVKTVLFRDTDLFSAEQSAVISVKDSDDVNRDMQLTSALFRKLQGTLGEIGEVMPANGKEDPPILVIRISDNGVEALADNRYLMIVGNAAFLKRNGIHVPREADDEAMKRSDAISMLYVAIDGTLKLSYEMEYSAKPGFEKWIRWLNDIDVKVAVHSYDPSLNDAFAAGCLSGPATVTVMKTGRFESTSDVEVSDTGAVALGDTNELIFPLFAANGIHLVRKVTNRMQFAAQILAAVLALLLSMTTLWETLNIHFILLFHSFWLLANGLITLTELSPTALRLKK